MTRTSSANQNIALNQRTHLTKNRSFSILASCGAEGFFFLAVLESCYQEGDLDAKYPHALYLSCGRLHQGEVSLDGKNVDAV